MRNTRFKGMLLSTLIIASLMVPAISLQYVSPISAAPEGLFPHESIYIEGNENFTPANGGVGDSETENDPYIMENAQLIELGRAFISFFSTSLVSPLELYNESSCKGVNPVDQPIDAVPQASSADTEAEINCQLAQSVSASFSRHIMCKDKDTNWNPVDPTTIFKPNDAKAGCLMTVSVNNKIESEWYYRSDTSKSWDYYTTNTSTVSPGSWYV